MSKKLILHIGMDKTGTSAIQKFLVDNSLLLESKYKTYYIKAGQSFDFAHNNLAYSMFEQNGQSNSDYQSYLKFIENEVSESNCEKYVLSSECLFKAYKSVNFQHFIDFIKQLFDEVSIIVYIRNQFDWVISRHKHSITSGQTMELDRLIKSWYCDYKQHVDKWKLSLDLGKADVRVYDKNQFSEGSIYTDFLEALDIKPLQGVFSFPKENINKSLNDECIEIKKAINLLDIDIYEKNIFNDNLYKLSLNKSYKRKNYFCSEQVELIKLKYSNTNNQLLLENDSKFKIDLNNYNLVESSGFSGVSKDLVIDFLEGLDNDQVNLINSSKNRSDDLILLMKELLKNKKKRFALRIIYKFISLIKNCSKFINKF